MRIHIPIGASLTALLAMTAPLSGQSGISYDFVSRVTTEGTDQEVAAKGKVYVQGNAARMEMSGGDKEDPGSQVTMLSLNGGEKFVFLIDQEKKYYEASTPALLSGVKSVMKSEATDVKLDIQKIGAGPTIQGYSTVHYRVKQSMTINVQSIMGGSSSTTEESVTDMYLAPQLKNSFNSLAGAYAFSANMDILGEEYKQKLSELDATVKNEGIPLRTEVTQKSVSDKGKETSSKVLYEVSNIKSGSIPASMFEIPAGYTQIEIPNMAGMTDSLQKALEHLKSGGKDSKAGSGVAADAKSVGDAAKEGAKEGAQEAAKEEAKDKAKKTIRKIFGK